MALQKEFKTRYGLVANYWRVEMITIDKRRKEGSISLNLYLDGQTTDVEFLESKAVSLNELEDKAIFDTYFISGEYEDIYNACYECVKFLDPFFKDATDV